MAKHAMPVSKAKTAYGLLSEVAAIIVEEPKRYDQDNWIADEGEVADDLMPRCGTVACIGGWIFTLKPPTKAERNREDFDGHTYAQECLGISFAQSWELFDFNAAGKRASKDGKVTARSLLAHAKRGAAHIARFQKKYAKQLKAKKV